MLGVYSKPKDQKTPRDERLRQWYLDIKELEEGDEKKRSSKSKKKKSGEEFK